MSYGRKNTEHANGILERVKDYSKLVPGNEYHLRKMISREGNSVLDETYDIVLKEFKEGFLIAQGVEYQYPVPEFEVFVRKKY